jgi:hypothetical protein
MLKPVNDNPQQRAPLSRERVLRGAVAVADADGVGVGSLTIRSLAHRLGVKPRASLLHAGGLGGPCFGSGCAGCVPRGRLMMSGVVGGCVSM